MMERDGRYYAKGRAVLRAPLATGAGTRMGFTVCELSDGVDDDGAREIAEALNIANDLAGLVGKPWTSDMRDAVDRLGARAAGIS